MTAAELGGARLARGPALLAAGWLLAFGAAPARGQALADGAAPVEVRAVPPTTLPGVALELAGESMAVAARRDVRLEVRPPAGPPVTLVASVDEEGAFAQRYTPAATGRYTVTATAPDGRGAARTTFYVVTAGAAVDEVGGAMRSAVATQRAAAGRLITLLDRAPPSEARERTRRKLEATLAAVQAVPDPSKELGDLDTELERWARANPMRDSVLPALLDVSARSRTLEAELERAAFGLDPSATVCDLLDDINGVLGVMGTLTDLWGSALGIFVNLFVDKVVNGPILDAVLQGVPPEQRLSVAEGIKLASMVAMGKLAAWSNVVTLLVDLASFVAGQAFESYCVPWSGRFTATYTQDLRRGPIRFWWYTMTLQGTVSLYYERGSGQAAVPLKGKLEGQAVAYTLGEDLAGLDPEIGRYVRARKAFAPRPGGRFAPGGRFVLPVSGVVQGRTLLLRVADEAAPDLSAVGRVFYVLMGMMPAVKVMWASLPYRNAAFVLNRGTRGSAALAIADGSPPTIEKTFTREDSGDTFRVAFEIQLKACSPACAP